METLGYGILMDLVLIYVMYKSLDLLTAAYTQLKKEQKEMKRRVRVSYE